MQACLCAIRRIRVVQRTCKPAGKSAGRLRTSIASCHSRDLRIPPLWPKSRKLRPRTLYVGLSNLEVSQQSRVRNCKHTSCVTSSAWLAKTGVILVCAIVHPGCHPSLHAVNTLRDSVKHDKTYMHQAQRCPAWLISQMGHNNNVNSE